MAAEQPWMIALGASPGKLGDDPGKLRSNDVKLRWNLRRCSAARASCVRIACGFTAGYRTPLLRSESQCDHHSAAEEDLVCLRSAGHTLQIHTLSNVMCRIKQM